MRIELSDGRTLDVAVLKKKMKNMVLRIYPDGRVVLSAPRLMSNGRIASFLDSKKDWLQKQLQKKDSLPQRRADRVRIFGEEFPFLVTVAKENRIFFLDGTLHIHAKNPSRHEAVLEHWWRGEALRVYTQYMEKWLHLLRHERLPRPELSVRKMKSMWGSCTCKQATIRLNYYLLQAPHACIEYVVLHELAHLRHPNHGAEFKAFLTNYMPDWKARRKLLHREPL